MIVPFDATAIAKAASKEDSRYSIAGVHFSRVSDQRCRVQATNGRILARLDFTAESEEQWPGDAFETVGDFQTILEAPGVAKLGKTLNRAGARATKARPILENFKLAEPCNGQGSISGLTADFLPSSTTVLSLENRFPDADAVIPKGAPEFSIRLNPELLRTLLEIASKTVPQTSDKDGQYVDLLFTDADSPVKVMRSYADRTFTGVIMPISGPSKGAA